MKIQFEDVAFRFRAILSGELTRDEVDRWAWEMMQNEDAGVLEYLPAEDEDRIWRGVLYLCGIDLPEPTCRSIFLLSDEDVRSAFEKIETGASL